MWNPLRQYSQHYTTTLALSSSLLTLSSANYDESSSHLEKIFLADPPLPFDNQAFSQVQALDPFIRRFGDCNAKTGKCALNTDWLSMFNCESRHRGCEERLHNPLSFDLCRLRDWDSDRHLDASSLGAKVDRLLDELHPLRVHHDHHYVQGTLAAFGRASHPLSLRRRFSTEFHTFPHQP